MAGGKPKFVPLRPKKGATNANDYYQLDMTELEVGTKNICNFVFCMFCAYNSCIVVSLPRNAGCNQSKN